MGKMIIFYPPSLSTEETLACAHHQTGSYSVRQHTDRIKVGIIAIHNELLIVKQTVCVATAHVNLSGITRASDCLERHSHSFVVANFFFSLSLLNFFFKFKFNNHPSHSGQAHTKT